MLSTQSVKSTEKSAVLSDDLDEAFAERLPEPRIVANNNAHRVTFFLSTSSFQAVKE